MSSFRCAVVTLLAVLGLCAVPSPVRGAEPSEPYLPRGIYVLIPAGQTTVDPRVLADPNVSGLQIRANWSKLQPRNNTEPDFTYFDDLIELARSAGKTVIIAVRRGLVGQGLPRWIPGPYFTCFDGTKGPLPWSAAYEEVWIALWTALVQRYENEPVVVGYHVGGIYSWKTADWDLCDVSSADREELLRRGYRVESIQQFALDFAAALAANTTKPFVLPVAGTMANSGAVSMDVTNTHIIAPLFALYGPTAVRPQFGIMRTIFRATTGDPLGVWNHDDLGEQFQTLYAWRPHIAGQREGSYNLPRLGKMLDISLHYGVQFMELGTAEIVLPGAGPLLACYRDALVVDRPEQEHCAHQ